MKSILNINRLLLLALWMAPLLAMAQADLQISKVFDKYSKHNKVVMVELSDQMLTSYNMKLYKSISITDNPTAVTFIRKCLETDQEGAKKIKQVMKGGKLSSAYYQLAKKGKDNRFILFKNDPQGTATLVYIETEVETDDIVKMLLKKN